MTPRPIHSLRYAGNLMLAALIALAILWALPVLAFGQSTSAPAKPTSPATQPVTIDPAARPEAVYNQAVAAWQAGALDQAETLFAEAIARGDTALASRARYNLGNCHYARALKRLENAQQPDAAGAIEQLDQAVSLYREALADNPADTDARANTELARTLIDQLKQQQKQQQQKQQKQQDQKDQSNKDQKDQKQNQQNQQKNQQDKKEQSKDKQDQNKQNNGQQSKKDDKQDKQQNKDQQKQNQADRKDKPEQKDENKQQSQEQQDQKQQNQQNPQPSQTQPADEQQGQPGQGQSASARPSEEDPRTLSQQEAARLLQQIRDRHLRRRIEKFQQQKQYQPPVDKDW